jgi:hypothetical protein
MKGRSMSQYLVLIYHDEQQYGGADEAALNEIMAGHQKFNMNNEKVIAGGNALQATSTATTIRPNGQGDFVVTDGPFAETKEVLGGYYLVDAADLDEAIALAKQVPNPYGSVEVRPIRVFE